MKSKFSKTWVASKQPRKQRKYLANAPNHLKRKFMGAMLDKPLKAKHGFRNIEVRKGDEVKVMRGKFKGKQGKVGTVEIVRTRVAIDGIQKTKKGGDKINVWFHPSSVKIMVLNLDDARRLKRAKKTIEDKSKVEKKEVSDNKKTESKTKQGETKDDIHKKK
jgi:large subunit ribosomal protein L24